MLHNCAMHFQVETDQLKELETLLTRLRNATLKQAGVKFAYVTRAPVDMPVPPGAAK